MASVHGQVPASPTLQELAEQNRRLQAQVEQQQRQIEAMNARLNETIRNTERQDQRLELLQGDAPRPTVPALSQGSIRLGGEAGFTFRSTGAGGSSPNSAFRVDDAKLFVEAALWRNATFFGGMNLTTREGQDDTGRTGEIYVQFENLLSSWGKNRALNAKVGRFDIPFGEEYQSRTVMENPLVSHSVADPWGVDEGVEVYGTVAGIHYVLAVQNGGIDTLHDFNRDKSIAGRLSYDPTGWLHLSGSAMRTGALNSALDKMSAEWIGGGFFRPIGAVAPATFSADLVQFDAKLHGETGTLGLTAGRARYGDSLSYDRHLRYYAVEGVRPVAGGLYAAARYSEIRAPLGYPLPGDGDFGLYFFQRGNTDRIRRSTIGLGYRFNESLILKTDYSVERARLSSGVERPKADGLSMETAVRF